MQDYYWYWLCNIKGVGNVRIKKLLDVFHTPEKIYHADFNEVSRVASFKEKERCSFIDSKMDTYLYEQYCSLKKHNVQFISYDSKYYPHRLKQIYDHPYGLYCRGEMPQEEKPVIAIVGARGCSSYGKSIAYEFAKQFAYMGFHIISGMATGIDAAAHRGCLDGHGKTFAIMGCGVDICYPRNNIELFMRTQQNGGIISEYCPGTQPFPGFFPRRNRIISGMSDLVIVVEARKKSGSLITVDQALEQNKDVMVIPGRVTDPLSEGCNNLIRMGAQILTTPNDVLENYTIASLLQKTKENQKIDQNEENLHTASIFLDDNGKNSLAREKNMLYSCLNLDPMSLDKIIEKTKLNITIVNQILLELQIEGVIEEVSKNSYIRSLT